MRGKNHQCENYPKDPCLTMHQPWASLLVYGIKRIEGRSWPSPIRGRLWIHAASKIPDAATVKAMEDFYRAIYELDGITDIKFPEEYPVSKLLGCVEVVGCLRGEELACWKAVPEGVRLEALTNFCWLCEHPQKLLDPLKMRGDQGVYNLERRISEAAVRGLVPVESPSSVRFLLPNPQDSYSLRPGSLPLGITDTEATEAEESPSLMAAIAGARVAATQFSKKDHKTPNYTNQDKSTRHSKMMNKITSISLDEDRSRTNSGSDSIDKTEGKSKFVYAERQKQPGSSSSLGIDNRDIGPSLIFTAAVKGIRPT